MRKLLLILLSLCLVASQVVEAKSSKRHKKAAEASASSAPRLSLDDQMHFDALYFEALSLRQRGEWDAGFMLMKRALEIDSTSSAALYYMYDAYRRLGRNYDAYGMIKLAVEHDSTSYWYNYALGELFRATRQMPAAQSVFERITRHYPDKSDPYYVLADLYLRQDSGMLCIDAINHIEEIDGINPQLTQQKFYILQEMGRSDEAFAEYDKLIERYPYVIQYRLDLGNMQMSFRQIEKAKATFEAARNIDPENAQVWAALADYYAIVGAHEEADTLLKAALRNPNIELRSKLKILNSYQKSILRKVQSEKDRLHATGGDTLKIADSPQLRSIDSLYQSIEAMHPSEAEVHKLYADYLIAIECDSLAAVQLQSAVAIAPDNKEYWEKLLTCSVGALDEPDVFALCEKAVTIHPNLIQAYTTRAFYYQMKEQNEEALKLMQEALPFIDKNNVLEISSHYGEIGTLLYGVGRKDEAYEAFETALKYWDKNYLVLNNYAYFLSEDNRDLSRAENMALKVIQKYPDNPTYIDTYAWILYKQGSYSVAKFYMQRIIDKGDPDLSPEIRQHWEAILKALDEK